MSAGMIELGAKGSGTRGYLAVPEAGSGPAVIVLQEWWGLVPQITRVCDRLAASGFCALAPDLYHGDLAEHTEMNKAGQLMADLPPDRAARDMLSAIDALLDHPNSNSSTVGITGFCMGGMLTLSLAALAGDRVSVAVPFYGAPLGDDAIDWENLSAQVEGHFAANDDFFPPDAVEELAQQLRNLGKEVTFHVYPGTGHGFTNEENPLNNWDADATALAWDRTLTMLARIT